MTRLVDPAEVLWVLQRQLMWRRIAESKPGRARLKRMVPDMRMREAVEAPIFEGEPFYVRNEIARLISSASRSLPEFAVTADMFPVPCAFVSLGVPIVDIGKTSQGVASFRSDNDAGYRTFGWKFGLSNDGLPGVWVTAYIAITRGAGYESVGPLAQYTEDFGPSHMRFFAFGDTSAMADDDEAVERARRRMGLSPGDDADKAIWRFVERWIFSFILFINQRLIATRKVRSQQRRSSATRRDQKPPPTLRVVCFRRYAPGAPASGEQERVDWTCQWMVKGHFRLQFFPKSGDHRPIWIMPFRKGPLDKPFREPAKRIFAAIR